MSATGSERATRTRAGPSKPAPKAKRKTAKQAVPEDEESDDFTEARPVSGDDDDVVEVEPPPTRKPAVARTNGKPATKGKGKAKADSVPPKKAPPRADTEEVEDVDDGGPVSTARAINDATLNNRGVKPPGGSESSIAVMKQRDRLRRQLENAQTQIQELSKQLEESYRVRHTEPEELMKRQTEKYEEIIQTKDLLIKQLQAMLGQKEPLSKEGKTSVLHMVTRERSADEQVLYWQRMAEAKDKELEDQARKIAELEQTHSDLKYEIKMERENSQKAARTPGSAVRVRAAKGPNAVLGSDDPKHSELVRFYEDVTNLLVTDIKIQEPKFFNLDEWNFTCIYTYSDKTGSEESKRSLSFMLRFTYDSEDNTVPVSDADLHRAAQYTPLNLDKESEEFAQALVFLGSGFTFPRKQLPLFFNTLVENMKAACEQDQSEYEEEAEDNNMQDIQVVE
ncbi:hypothetical protein C8J57DRAFT_1286666 [Mycena rebaudengoi]|nr:hypothetical protein C8J57DRAFT_1286666 [Mycena rebaudengoi]